MMFLARRCGSPHRLRRQSGVTLIEALVTFVILSVGLLGIVSLQAISKTSQHQGIQRSNAVMLANDLVERIRINPGGLATYSAGGLATPFGGGTLSAPTTDCAATACTATQLAAYDLWLWEQGIDGATVTVTGSDAVVRNAAGLIAPRACVRFTADTGMARTGLVDVIIQWRGLGETQDAVTAGDGEACGGAAAGADDFRRQLVVSTFVIDEAEL
ncbi:MAG: type IV pilus modification protein PilV [Haliea sp.]|nr:type IV pilus modification protein PilV [Haliea sp.]